jgi:hypothetical protein
MSGLIQRPGGLVTSEFTMEPFGCFSARCGSLLDSVECANVMRAAVFRHAGDKSSSELNQEYAFHSRGAVAVHSLVGEISRIVSHSKIRATIVPFVAINVVDYSRNRFAIDQQPREPVSQEPGTVYVNSEIAVGSGGPSNRSGIAGIPSRMFMRPVKVLRRPFAPSEFTGCLVIVQALANILARWQHLESHLILLPGSLVRRAVAWQALPFSAGGIS